MRVGSWIKLIFGLVVFVAIFMAGFTAGGMVTSGGMLERDAVADCLPADDMDALQTCLDGQATSEPSGEGGEPAENTEPAEQGTERSDGGGQAEAPSQSSEGAQEPAEEEEETLSEDEAREAMEEAMTNVLWEPDGKWVYNDERSEWEFQVEGIYAGVSAAGEPDREPAGTWAFDYGDERWTFTPEEG